MMLYWCVPVHFYIHSFDSWWHFILIPFVHYSLMTIYHSIPMVPFPFPIHSVHSTLFVCFLSPFSVFLLKTFHILVVISWFGVVVLFDVGGYSTIRVIPHWSLLYSIRVRSGDSPILHVPFLLSCLFVPFAIISHFCSVVCLFIV